MSGLGLYLVSRRDWDHVMAAELARSLPHYW